MASVPIYDMSKKKVGSVELSDTVFAGEVRLHLLNDAVRAQMARRYEFRTANAFTRSEVHGTRRKMFRQKGTGQARHGDAKAPIFVGGGKAHGPRPRRVRHKINKKVARAALMTALALNFKDDRLFIVDKLEVPKCSTKAVSNCLAAFGFENALIVNVANGPGEKQFNLSARNVAGSKCLKPEGLNVVDILKYKNLILSKAAAEIVSQRLITHV